MTAVFPAGSQAGMGDAEAGSNTVDAMASLSHLLHGFNFELFGVTFAAHSYLLRLFLYNSGVSRKLGAIQFTS